MKILGLTISGIPNFNSKLEIEFVAKQRVAVDDKERLSHVFSQIYANNVISFIGINASGKTTILKVISFVLRMLNNESINNIPSKEVLNELNSNQTVIITSYFYHNDEISKLETQIGKEMNEVDGSERLVITDEFLWSKGIGRIKTKKSMYDFGNADLKIKRDQSEQYLMDDVSIMVAVNKKNNIKFFVRDMLRWTDHNMLSVLGKFPRELLTFLDPSIEYLECTKEEKDIDIRLKFFGREEIIIKDLRTVERYLSSGTVKGLSVYMSAVLAFVTGGYLIVDEIENHFNREIVATLMRLFMESKVNRNGATLIYSTHYSELLDEFDRNDSIYIVRNRGGITAENLSHILKRNDLKKSEVYDSDYLGGTVPVYEAYMALKKVLMHEE